ncbi:MAG: bifunctional phosphoribosylaminoimidazolecarboxamide formyltransferase/IMP cyclohydrolase [Gammaproteobacteria bacterium]|nr:bifunctional phosphoribosylaminoimidazolecarboxamide formyltransferase/IMP cyclohydrolase [Gammaproteobacteria bacterium]
MKQAFLSVSNKEGLEDLARQLIQKNIQLIASEGTADFLRSHKIVVTPVSDYLKLEPFLDGRVKTLHPNLYGGILADRSNASHMTSLQDRQIELIDFVIVDLYPFEKNQHDAILAIENMDIGGVSLIRAAAKNYNDCTVVCHEHDYATLMNELEINAGETTLAFRKKMAISAFRKTRDYDANIANFLAETSEAHPNWKKTIALAYGENPHQKAGFYTQGSDEAAFTLLQGKPFSYNNLLDLDAGIRLVLDFKEHAATVMKHTNPCGMAIARTPLAAIQKAFEADPKSAFGGIVVVNQPLDVDGANFLSPHFLELIAAPAFTADALTILSQKKKCRIVQYQPEKSIPEQEIKTALNGHLIQDPDKSLCVADTMHSPTVRKPTPQLLQDLKFAYQLVKHVKSNAIVIVKQGVSIGIGAGQMSRVDAVELALKKASHQDLTDAVLASDGFFPFADSIELIKQAGIQAIIQPGGSIRDSDIITACNALALTMVFTGQRSFKH